VLVIHNNQEIFHPFWEKIGARDDASEGGPVSDLFNVVWKQWGGRKTELRAKINMGQFVHIALRTAKRLADDEIPDSQVIANNNVHVAIGAGDAVNEDQKEDLEDVDRKKVVNCDDNVSVASSGFAMLSSTESNGHGVVQQNESHDTVLEIVSAEEWLKEDDEKEPAKTDEAAAVPAKDQSSPSVTTTPHDFGGLRRLSRVESLHRRKSLELAASVSHDSDTNDLFCTPQAPQRKNEASDKHGGWTKSKLDKFCAGWKDWRSGDLHLFLSVIDEGKHKKSLGKGGARFGAKWTQLVKEDGGQRFPKRARFKGRKYLKSLDVMDLMDLGIQSKQDARRIVYKIQGFS